MTNLPSMPAESGSTGHDNKNREDLVFHGSDEPSIGVELELPILDRDTGDLAPGAPRILQVCKEEKIEGVGAELMQSMLEFRTGVCKDVAQVRDDLLPRIKRVRNIAASLGYDLAMLGTHPFLRPSASTVYPSERFEQLMAKWAWMTYYRVTFGLHIHIGMKNGEEAIGVMNASMRYLPHLLAASANSPFWNSVDTGLSSCRAVLYSMVPHSGVPVTFGKWKDFRSYYQVMRDGQAIESFKDIKWDVRPRPDLGTVEFRICDTPGSLSMVLALAALTRSLVISSKQLLADRPHLKRGDVRRSWLTVENRWLAGRHGLKAMAVHTAGGKRRLLADEIADLAGKLSPQAQPSGDDKFLAPLLHSSQIDSGAERQRQLYRQGGNWRVVMEELTKRFNQELDRAVPTPATPATAPPAAVAAGRGG